MTQTERSRSKNKGDPVQNSDSCLFWTEGSWLMESCTLGIRVLAASEVSKKNQTCCCQDEKEEDFRAAHFLEAVFLWSSLSAVLLIINPKARPHTRLEI